MATRKDTTAGESNIKRKTVKKIIIGNWKMNPGTARDADKLFSAISKAVSTARKTDVAVCAPFVYLERLKKSSRKVMLGAQDAFYGDTGAYTGQVSAFMLDTMGIRYAIVGHSEKRARADSNTEVNKKVKAALAAGLMPIVCVGELARDDKHEYFNFVKKQLTESLDGISRTAIARVLLAYEPVWAISTTPDRRDATAEDCREMVIFIRKVLSDKFGADGARMWILYGGSVNEKDAAGFLTDGGADGLLVGRASLDAKKFGMIVQTCETSNK